MDIKVTLTDEDGQLVDSFSIYQDGSDSEGCETIRELIGAAFTIEDDGDPEFDALLNALHDVAESSGGPCPYCELDSQVDEHDGQPDEGNISDADWDALLAANARLEKAWPDASRTDCPYCVIEEHSGIMEAHDCKYENDEDDGQPTEAQEWYDYDPDC